MNKTDFIKRYVNAHYIIFGVYPLGEQLKRKQAEAERLYGLQVMEPKTHTLTLTIENTWGDIFEDRRAK